MNLTMIIEEEKIDNLQTKLRSHNIVTDKVAILD
ncbi:hypothetical protein NIES267_33130 [Calothrix parasitica NIES-267]|uniref:Uncharacterized protein n=1 Tax=Calothrix parasitica NIES-267 TaxID=1973488 RepID=A0A1Z4LRF9_9CYAN|nr:hypothetical protein NIES267_33130 [Calothrix parasitica NIES-267]